MRAVARRRCRFRWNIPITTATTNTNTAGRRLVSIRRIAVWSPLSHATTSSRRTAQPYPRLANPLCHGIGHLNVDLIVGHAPGMACDAGVGVVGGQCPVSKFAARIITQIQYGGGKGKEEQTEGTECRRFGRLDVLQARYVKWLVD